MKKAFFAGSFDPFTAGHLQIVTEGLRLFDAVVVGIGVNTEKHSLLSVESRKRLIEDALRAEENVEVVVYEGFTGDTCRATGCCALLRGVRSSADFEYERQLADVNRTLYEHLQTVVLISSPQLSACSSSVVREIVRFEGDPQAFMPEGIDIYDYM